MGEIPLLWSVGYRLIKVQKAVNLLLVVQMVGYGAETVILGNGGNVALAIVLP